LKKRVVLGPYRDRKDRTNKYHISIA